MTLSTKRRMSPMSLRSKLIICGLLAVIVMLTSCVKSTPAELSIYSPQYLYVPSGTVIKTSKGVYKSQVDEKWVSFSLYQDIENENKQLIEALKKANIER